MHVRAGCGLVQVQGTLNRVGSGTVTGVVMVLGTERVALRRMPPGIKNGEW